MLPRGQVFLPKLQGPKWHFHDAKQGVTHLQIQKNNTIQLLAASKKQFPDINILKSESRALGRDSLDIASTRESWHQN
jgi:hypothetical protein